MGLFSTNKTSFPWIALNSLEQLEEVINSESKIVLFKHSTRCSISSFALRNFEREFDSNSDISCYLVDLISFREVSNAISEKTKVMHQSPQVVFLDNKKVVYSASHEQISAEKINKLSLN
ncbi:MAG: bacillithiol system redox-active protein YtxJ [Bacteroidota bacterium]